MLTTDTTASETGASAASAPIGIDAVLFHEVDELNQRIRDAESYKKELVQRRDALNDQLVEQYAVAGMGVGDDLSIGGRKGTLQGLTWACKVDDSVTPGQIVAALREDKLEWLISETYDSARLSSHLRELETSGDPISPALARVIEGRTRYRVTFSRSRRRSSAPPPPVPSQPADGESPD